ncbi:hypothetical protein PV735_45990 [Streptomyces turgidiscabies]|uniref:Uncharacterized protein n=1 Tax=Streptomyces turgidiscabies (strain Car8) TaxID=698760 RepID=L7F4C9_STRT8|nr:hypothetical protein [Streptomyces turgidiscabies]ELP66147.1 hypothetical protein STRTUCAR8_01714 [Streptomyces turgidiscabies Car8]MDX3499977.1 hypothetical protein [Streptomyces turgidiscabies]
MGIPASHIQGVVTAYLCRHPEERSSEDGVDLGDASGEALAPGAEGLVVRSVLVDDLKAATVGFLGKSAC